jgi:hypothetical protein
MLKEYCGWSHNSHYQSLFSEFLIIKVIQQPHKRDDYKITAIKYYLENDCSYVKY